MDFDAELGLLSHLRHFMMPIHNRFHQIDLLRFLAALSVMFFHYSFRGYAADNMSPLSFPALGALFRYGYLGVDLFFIISGFVILLTALKRNARDFVISRAVRLYPAFWFCVSLTFVTTLLIGGGRYHAEFWQYLVNLSMLHGYLGVKHIDAVYWSLLVELKFYFLVFLLIIFRQIQNTKYFLGVWLAISILLSTYDGASILRFFLFPEWSAYFIAGATFYLVYLEGLTLYKAVIILVAYLQALWNAYFSSIGMIQHYGVEFDYLVIFGVISVFFSLFFLIAIKKMNVLNRTEFVLLGALTYPLYLLHQNIGFMIFNELHSHVSKYVLLVGCSFFMFLLAYFVHKYVEERFSKSFHAILVYLAALPANLFSRLGAVR